MRGAMSITVRKERAEDEAGVYEVLWDGTDERGGQVSNGIYFTG